MCVSITPGSLIEVDREDVQGEQHRQRPEGEDVHPDGDAPGRRCRPRIGPFISRCSTAMMPPAVAPSSATLDEGDHQPAVEIMSEPEAGMDKQRRDARPGRRRHEPAASRRSRRKRASAMRLRSDRKAATADRPSSVNPLTCFQSRCARALEAARRTQPIANRARPAAAARQRSDQRQHGEREHRPEPADGLVLDGLARSAIARSAAGTSRRPCRGPGLALHVGERAAAERDGLADPPARDAGAVAHRRGAPAIRSRSAASHRPTAGLRRGSGEAAMARSGDVP